MINDLLEDCVSKIKRYSCNEHRTAVGENISIPIFCLSDSKAIKAFILNQGGSLVY